MKGQESGRGNEVRPPGWPAWRRSTSPRRPPPPWPRCPGKVLTAELDDENGNLVYSVEVMTHTREVKDVKVDAGNGTVLHVDADDHDEADEDDEHVP